MKKKILIGSIIAVAILVLVSFTGVVGYQTTKSSTIANASPLFTVRSCRAIDINSNDVTSNYIGKGTDDSINIPTRDITQLKVQRLINLIRSLDDDKFDKFTVPLVSILEKQDFDDVDTIINQIKSIRNDKDRIILSNNADRGEYTWFAKFHPYECWFPFKALFSITALLVIIILTSLPYDPTFIQSSCIRTCPGYFN